MCSSAAVFLICMNIKYYYLCTVDDVSAQTSCVISPDLTALTLRNPLGRPIEFHCQCMDDNGIITGIRWFNGSTLVYQNESFRPYSTNTVPSRLIFSSPFTDADNGTYTCSPNSTYPTIPPGDAITLSAGSEYVRSYIAVLLCIYYLANSDTQQYRYSTVVW